MCAGGSWLGNGPNIELEAKFQGVKGLFTGESLFYLEACGSGPLLVNAFGQIEVLDVTDKYVIDSGHVVAFVNLHEVTKSMQGPIRIP